APVYPPPTARPGRSRAGAQFPRTAVYAFPTAGRSAHPIVPPQLEPTLEGTPGKCPHRPGAGRSPFAVRRCGWTHCALARLRRPISESTGTHTMLDPRLQYTEVQRRQRELAEQAARDRLAASQHAERHALGRLLTAAGTALLALGRRLHGAPAPAPEHVSDRRLVAANGPSAQVNAVCQGGALVHMRLPRRSPCTGKQPPAGSE